MQTRIGHEYNSLEFSIAKPNSSLPIWVFDIEMQYHMGVKKSSMLYHLVD